MSGFRLLDTPEDVRAWREENEREMEKHREIVLGLIAFFAWVQGGYRQGGSVFYTAPLVCEQPGFFARIKI